MPRLKGIIFSLRDVIVRKGAFDARLFAELGKLIVWLRNQGVQPVFVGNAFEERFASGELLLTGAKQ
jgi:hypothetical protein